MSRPSRTSALPSDTAALVRRSWPLAAAGAAAPAGRTPPSPAPRHTPTPCRTRFSDTFADPSVIRGRDGWWYAYATSDPLRAGDAAGR